MLVELVNGSPYKNGSTSVALAEVERTLHEQGIEPTHSGSAQNHLAAALAAVNVRNRANAS